MEMQIENQKRNRKNRIEKVNLTIENEFYTIEECKIITPMNETENIFSPGMMLYEKSEIPNSKRLYLEHKSAQIFVTRMIDKQDFDSLFRLNIYVEGYLLQGDSESPIIFSESAVKRIKTYHGLTVKKQTTLEIFTSQGSTPRRMPEGDFYIGCFTDNKSKTDLFLQRGPLTDKISVWSIQAAEKAKADYQKECEKRSYLDNDGNLILDKWKEFLKTKTDF